MILNKSFLNLTIKLQSNIKIIIANNKLSIAYNITMYFDNRSHAGLLLSKKLKNYIENKSTVILALPRGGVPIAKVIASDLNLPISVYMSQKIALSREPELGIGAVSELNTIYFHPLWNKYKKNSSKEIKKIINNAKLEISRRIKLYRSKRRLPIIKNKTIILVDDGLAMGVTAIASIKSLKKRFPKKIIFSTPVCSEDSAKLLTRETGVNVISLISNQESKSISHFYRDFSQLTDRDVIDIINLHT